MTTTNTTKGWMLSLLSALFLLSGLAACDSTEGTNEDKPDKPKPEVPVTDSDWQVVPATGGTINKDSISITFPSGTFAEDTKVAISEVKKGEIGGELEASKFYQIAMPCTANQPITIRMKSNEVADNICFVAQANAYCMSAGEFKKRENHYETSYSNGEYTTTIPTIMGDDKDTNIYFTIGLGHIIDPETGKARTRGLTMKALSEGKVQNINYQLRYYWTLLEEVNWLKNGDPNYEKALKASITIDHYIQQALTLILDLGFKLDGEKTLYVDFDPTDFDWGGHQVSALPFGIPLNFHDGWNMYVSLGRNMFIEPFDPKQIITEDQKRCTIIHEIFHWFQSFYDPRSNHQQATEGGEFQIMYEMGAVWIENLINNGNLQVDFINENFAAPVKKDRLGLTNVLNLWSDSDKNKRYQSQGYCQGPLLYYLCSTPEKNNYGINQKSVVELHEEWKKNFSRKTTLEILDWWTYGIHTCPFFIDDEIDDYYIKLFSGKLTKGIDALSMYKASFEDNKYEKMKLVREGREPDKIIQDSFDKLSFESTVYPFGCTVRSIQFLGMKDISLKDKKLVIKQEREGIQTYLITTGKSSEYKTYRRTSQVATGKDSIVISGSTLEGLRQSDGSFDQYFFLLTTRKENSINDSESRPWKVTVELMDTISVVPDKLEFPAEGDSMKVLVNYGSYKYYGYKIEDKDRSWISAKIDKTNGVGVKFTVTPNTTGSPRETTVYCFVTNEEKSTDAQLIYLPVKIKQAAADSPSVFPTELTFEASGGTQSVKVTAQGYTKFGYHIDKEYSSWLTGKAISGGTVEITAQLNDTGKERTATIQCFVTNVDNATDDQKVFMPVTIVQKANQQQIEEIVLYFDYELAGITEIVPDKQGRHWYSNKNEIVVSGGHISCSYRNTYNSYHELSFDIDDMNKLENKAARISNIKAEGKTYNENGKLLNQWNISANCQTTNSNNSKDGITYYGWDWGKNSFYIFSGSGPGWTPSTVDLSDMSDAYGSITIKFIK